MRQISRFLAAPAACAAAAFVTFSAARAQTPAPAVAAGLTGIKYMRDSEEYAALARQTYRMATDSVVLRSQKLASGSWAVVLDIDETALDNSTYQLDRAAYALPFEIQSWDAWILRREAGAVPGVADFVAGVRRAGGRVAWITNRDAVTSDATRGNLRSLGLLADGDRFCPQDSPQRTKAVRRAEVVSGRGDCAWPGTAVRVLAFLGDQMGDFPSAEEHIPDTGTDESFGRTCFLLPNSMYGDWTARVTRRR
ncbi:MAG TPA: HAD family acid phosphatase [Vicinamibacterales bacterium]|nr:HAD family acid phosphatase [Vicinamibacterales bacterium]